MEFVANQVREQKKALQKTKQNCRTMRTNARQSLGIETEEN
jgi:hypothetical protein